MIAHAEAAGKLILIGEHSVVYGYPALALALPNALSARAYYRADLTTPHLSLPHLKVSLPLNEPQSAHLSLDPLLKRLHEAWALAWRHASCCAERAGHARSRDELSEEGALEVIIEGALPFKVGLGSSAALALALLRVLGRVRGYELTEDELDEGAWALERVFHGAPSGLDHTTSLRGGVLRFEPQPSPPNASSPSHPSPASSARFTPLALTLPLYLVVCWTPREGGTAEAVAHVRGLMRGEGEGGEREQRSARARLEHLGALTSSAERCLTEVSARAQSAQELKERLLTLGVLFDEAHDQLTGLGVSTPKLEELRAQLKAQGALGAKLTGAGFGGAVFGVFEGAEQAREAAERLGGLFFEC